MVSIELFQFLEDLTVDQIVLKICHHKLYCNTFVCLFPSSGIRIPWSSVATGDIIA